MSAAILCGWTAGTWAVAILTTWVTWLFSLMLLLFSVAGWKFIWTVATEGIYVLSREKDG